MDTGWNDFYDQHEIMILGIASISYGTVGGCDCPNGLGYEAGFGALAKIQCIFCYDICREEIEVYLIYNSINEGIA